MLNLMHLSLGTATLGQQVLGTAIGPMVEYELLNEALGLDVRFTLIAVGHWEKERKGKKINNINSQCLILKTFIMLRKKDIKSY